MLVLKDNPAPVIIDLPGPVRLTCRRLTAIDRELAHAQAMQNLGDVANAATIAARYGLRSADPDAVKAARRSLADRYSVAMAVEVGVMVITAWEGVGSPTGVREADGVTPVMDTAEINAENLGQLMNEWATVGVSYAELFLGAIGREKVLLAQSKNVSSSAPVGGGAGESSIAPTAAKTETAAPMG